MDNLIYILVKIFRLVEDLYNVGIPPSAVGVYKCSFLENDTCLIESTYVMKKCYRMPFWQNIDENDSCFTDDNDVSTIL